MQNSRCSIATVRLSALVCVWLFCVAPAASFADRLHHYRDVQQIGAEQLLHVNPKAPFLRSSAALLMDKRDGITLVGRHIHDRYPIASLTKLMTAMVVLDKELPLDDMITIADRDRDRLRGSPSRLRIGVKLSRRDILLTALAASDNRAAAALARTYPGGRTAFVRAMNEKARRLGMGRTHFADPAGLDNNSVSTASDLAKMVNAAVKYPLIDQFTTTKRFSVRDRRSGRRIAFVNTNRLVRSSKWRIHLSKTGYTDDAGNCLVMQATIAARPVIIVLLDSWGRLSKYGDSARLRAWLLKSERRAMRLSDSHAD